MKQIRFTKEELIPIIKESYTIADVCRKCGWKPTGANYKIVHKYIKEYGLDVSHFTGKCTNIGNKLNTHNAKPITEFLTKNSYIKTSSLKLKIIKEGLKVYKCEKCGATHWNDEQIVLQLHHINGDSSDNRLENLMLLCPNCHSQTENYCGNHNQRYKTKYYCKGCGKEIEPTRTQFCDECYEKITTEGERLEAINKNFYNKTIYGYCKICGNEIYSKSKYGLCDTCVHTIAMRKVKDRPSKEVLQELINRMPYTQIGKMYGVNDNTIRKWCKRYGIEKQKIE